MITSVLIPEPVIEVTFLLTQRKIGFPPSKWLESKNV